MINSIKEVYLKKLNALLAEITLYSNEENIWKTAPGITNSGGTLTLHLIGNLKFFVGAYLGNTGYVRDRDKEFSERNVPQQNLISDVKETIRIVDETLSEMNDDDIQKPYPIDKFGEDRTNGYVLVYLLAHLNYHLGQVNYLRRILST